jgi:hypothetical protein
MGATTNEKENLSELNQARTESESQKIKSSSNKETLPRPNSAEMIIVLFAAITVDAIGILDLTGFGAILTRIATFPAFAGLWLWRTLKQQSSPKKDPAFQILIPFLAEISPFGILPSWTCYVIYLWIKDSKSGGKIINKIKKPKT